jgi:hypothetical protein
MQSYLGTATQLSSAPATEVVAGHLLVDNDLNCTQAATVVDLDTTTTLPYVTSVSVVSAAVLTVSQNTDLVLNGGLSSNQSRPREQGAVSKDCSADQAVAFMCSYIYLGTNGASNLGGLPSVLAFGLLPSQDGLLIDAESVYLASGGMLNSPKLDSPVLNVTSKWMTTMQGSSISFRYRLGLHLAYGALLGGAVHQEFSAQVHEPGAGFHMAGLGVYNPSPEELEQEHVNITVGGTISVYSSVVLFATVVQLRAGAYVGVPRGWNACWARDVNFFCPGLNSSDTSQGSGIATRSTFYPPDNNVVDVLSNGTVYVAATQSVSLEEGGILHAPAILVCSEHSVNVAWGATLRADGLGCSANDGPAPGGVAYDETDDFTYGGSGAGNGGSGGAVSAESEELVVAGGLGMKTYPSPLTSLSSGSGGGCYNKNEDGVGGCYNQTYAINGSHIANLQQYYNSGGGIVVIYGRYTVNINGAVTANGGGGNVMYVPEGSKYNDESIDVYVGSGGGAGGSVAVATVSLLGYGNFSAHGGRGGGTNSHDYVPTDYLVAYSGGGGAGGQVRLYSVNPSTGAWAFASGSMYNFTGLVSVKGGLEGVAEDLEYVSRRGNAGVVLWPSCNPGFGNSFVETASGLYSLDSLCQQCPIGEFSSGGNMEGPIGPHSFQTNCSSCNALVSADHAHYSQDRSILSVNAKCLCTCNEINTVKVERGHEKEVAENCYAGESECISYLDWLMYSNFGGVGGFVGVCIAVFAVLVAAFSRKHIYEAFKKKRKGDNFARSFGTKLTSEGKDGDAELKRVNSNNTDVSGDNSGGILAVQNPMQPLYRYDDVDDPDDDDDTHHDSFNPIARYAAGEKHRVQSTEMVSMSPREGSGYPATATTVKVMTRTDSTDAVDRERRAMFHVDEQEDSAIHRARALQLKAKLSDTDLPYHCHRMYLYGTNHPFAFRGGPWKMSVQRPPSLRPMLHPQAYYDLASKINEEAHWLLWGWEVLFYVFVCIFFPPFAPEVLFRRRRARAMHLLQLITSYDHHCFRHPLQRLGRRSLRMGVSRCCTLAYVDFLYDYGENKRDADDSLDVIDELCSPLAPIGQNKLPIVFKCAGMGTFFTPFYMDTNDILVQSISQTDVPSKFIQRSWIDFVVELNNRLRTVQPSGMRYGLKGVVQFLENVNDSNELGGIVVELVTFSNAVPVETMANLRRRRRAEEEEEEVGYRYRDEEEGGQVDLDGPAPQSRGSDNINRTSRTSTASSTGSDHDRFSSSGGDLANGPVGNFVPAKVPRGSTLQERRSSAANLAPIREGEMSSRRSTVGGSGQTFFRHGSVFDQKQKQGSFIDTFGRRSSVTKRPTLSSRLRALSLMRGSTASNVDDGDDNTFSYLFNSGGKSKHPEDGNHDDDGAKEASHHMTIGEHISFLFSATQQWLQDVSPSHEGDTHGLLMNFDETCASIASGKMSIGIRVTAPKMDKMTRVLTDEDYLSDDEEEMMSLRGILAGNTRESVLSSADAVHEDEEDEDEDTKSRVGKPDDNNVKDTKRWPGTNISHTSSTTSTKADAIDSDAIDTVAHSIKNAYGTKGSEKEREMLRFYRIMLDAEKHTQVQLSGEQSMDTAGSATDTSTIESQTEDRVSFSGATMAEKRSMFESKGDSGRRGSVIAPSSVGPSGPAKDPPSRPALEALSTTPGEFQQTGGDSSDEEGGIKSFARSDLGASSSDSDGDNEDGTATAAPESPHVLAIESLFGGQATPRSASSSTADGKRKSSIDLEQHHHLHSSGMGMSSAGHTPGLAGAGVGRRSSTVPRDSSIGLDRGLSVSHTGGLRVTRRNRDALASFDLAPSAHQYVSANPWRIQSLEAKRARMFGLNVMTSLTTASSTITPTPGATSTSDNNTGTRDEENIDADNTGSKDEETGTDRIPSANASVTDPFGRRDVDVVVSAFMITQRRFWFANYSSEYMYTVKDRNKGQDQDTAGIKDSRDTPGAPVVPREPYFDASAFNDVDQLKYSGESIYSLTGQQAPRESVDSIFQGLGNDIDVMGREITDETSSNRALTSSASSTKSHERSAGSTGAAKVATFGRSNMHAARMSLSGRESVALRDTLGTNSSPTGGSPDTEAFQDPDGIVTFGAHDDDMAAYYGNNRYSNTSIANEAGTDAGDAPNLSSSTTKNAATQGGGGWSSALIGMFSSSKASNASSNGGGGIGDDGQDEYDSDEEGKRVYPSSQARQDAFVRRMSAASDMSEAVSPGEDNGGGSAVASKPARGDEAASSNDSRISTDDTNNAGSAAVAAARLSAMSNKGGRSVEQVSVWAKFKSGAYVFCSIVLPFFSCDVSVSLSIY